tara:strand:- start:265 stop:921 length:657 start_codon:yes stop_codon:yes gene_type:complete
MLKELVYTRDNLLKRIYKFMDNVNTLEELFNKNKMNMDGYSKQIKGQVDFLRTSVQNPLVENVMEIGFNGGHSSELFLETNSNINVISFDICGYNCVRVGKNFIDKKFPGRHTLIKGNSLESVPKYASDHDIKFDVIFIDGGHAYDIVKGDIMNCKRLAHKDTLVILDDTVKDTSMVRHWNNGPNKAWEEAKSWNLISEIGYSDYELGRGQSWGNYIL